MGNSHKHYDYYQVEGEDVKELIESYDEISSKRKLKLQELLDEFGAEAFVTTSGFGDKGSSVLSLGWFSDYSFPCPVTIKRRGSLDGKRLVFARGKGNTKEGRAFNKLLDNSIKKTNESLKDLPSLEGYIIEHYGVLKTGFGEPSGNFGIAMLTTYAGLCPGRDDCLLFAVPKSRESEGHVRHGEVIIPPNFTSLTYGQFYDLSNSE